MSKSKSTKKVVLITSIVFLTLIFIVGGSLLLLSIARRYSSPQSFSPSSISYETLPFPGRDLGFDSVSSYEVTETYIEQDNVDSKIRKSGDVTVLVDDLDDSYSEVLKIMRAYQGSLLNSYESGSGNARRISFTLKVESIHFENIYEEIRDIDGQLDYASYQTDDVTMQYTDLQSRLRNLKATESQLVRLLDSAENVSETLEVYTELTRIRSQIEVIEGQIKYLDSQVDYSYITVNLMLSDVGKTVADDSWRPEGVFRNAFSSLLSLGKSIVNILIWIVVFTPLWLIIYGMYFFIIRAKNKK